MNVAIRMITSRLHSRRLLFFLGMIAFFSLLSPYFLSWENITNIFIQSSVHIVLAVGMTLVLASGGIDLSCGSILALSGIAGAVALKAGAGPITGISVCIGCGALMGLINGVGIAGLSISPFIVTLGTSGIFRALALIFTDAQPIYGFPATYRFLGTGWIDHVPVSVVVAILIAGAGYLLVGWTGFGTHARAIGDNEEGAFRMGVSVFSVRLGVYVLSGISAALAGMIMVGRLNTAEAIAGLGIELEVIAAVVIGGTGFSGGRAKIFGAMLGALIIGTLANGLTIINVQTYYQQLVIGVVFMAVVLTDQLRKKDPCDQPGRKSKLFSVFSHHTKQKRRV